MKRKICEMSESSINSIQFSTPFNKLSQNSDNLGTHFKKHIQISIPPEILRLFTYPSDLSTDNLYILSQCSAVKCTNKDTPNKDSLIKESLVKTYYFELEPNTTLNSWLYQLSLSAVNGSPTVTTSTAIVNGKIEVDCALFVQLCLLDPNLKASRGKFSLKLPCPLDIPGANYIGPTDPKLHSIFQNHSTISKGQWVIYVYNSHDDVKQFIGLGDDGVTIKSFNDWGIELTLGIWRDIIIPYNEKIKTNIVITKSESYVYEYFNKYCGISWKFY